MRRDQSEPDMDGVADRRKRRERGCGEGKGQVSQAREAELAATHAEPTVLRGETHTDYIREAIKEDLRSGRFDRVHTRFPPEPNAYLHIGHAKAVWIDYGIALDFGGLFNLRFDGDGSATGNNGALRPNGTITLGRRGGDPDRVEGGLHLMHPDAVRPRGGGQRGDRGVAASRACGGGMPPLVARTAPKISTGAPRSVHPGGPRKKDI